MGATLETTARPVLIALVLAFAVTVIAPLPATAICICFPCPDCAILSRGQLNFVRFDADAGTITMIPNIRVAGDSPSFSLVVPTPGLPTLEPVDRALWTEASALSAPVRRQSGSGCGGEVLVPAPDGVLTDAEDGVIVVSRQIVGGFEATILTADDADALVDWLAANDFAITPEQAAVFAPYVTRAWVFTAMKLAPGNSMPPQGWDTNVDPVAFTFESEEFELPLPLFAVNRAAELPIVVYVVAAHRMTIPGFDTVYADHVSRLEHAAMREQYPTLAALVETGEVLTRLDRTFTTDLELRDAVKIVPSRMSSEYQRVVGVVDRTVSFGSVLLVVPFGWALWRSRRRRAA